MSLQKFLFFISLYKTRLTNLMDLGSSGKPLPMLDLMLTAQYLEYAKLVWHGVSEKQSQSLQWLLPRKKASYAALLDSLLSGRDLLANAPVYSQYFPITGCAGHQWIAWENHLFKFSECAGVGSGAYQLPYSTNAQQDAWMDWWLIRSYERPFSVPFWPILLPASL